MLRPQAPKGASELDRPLRVEPRPEALPEWVGAVHSVPLILRTPPFVAEDEAVVGDGDQDGERDGHSCHTQTTTAITATITTTLMMNRPWPKRPSR